MKKTVFKAAVTLLFTWLTTATAWADNINYYDPTAAPGEQTKQADATQITSGSTTLGTSGNTTWYYVSGTTTVDSRINVQGTVNIILTDNCTFTASDGIHVVRKDIDGINALNIYAQKAGDGCGALAAYRIKTFGGNAGIGGNEGDAMTVGDAGEDAGDITIYGGCITAVSIGGGPGGAGTGGQGDGGSGGDGGNANVTIHGGIVSVDGGTIGPGAGGFGVDSSVGVDDGKDGEAGDGTVTLNWTNTTDRISAYRYHGTVSVTAGKAFLTNDETPALVSNGNVGEINEKTLRPCTKTDIQQQFLGGNDADGSADHPYVISNADGWIAFRIALENNEWGGFSGKIVQLANNISVNSMAATENHKFQGTFDGNNHTLEVELINPGTYAAPFRYINGATIKNLNVSGTISTPDKFAAGIAAHTVGTNAVTNCVVSATISSSVEGDGTHGGFLGVIDEGKTSVTGSLFSGKLLGTKTQECGGFAGWVENKDYTSLTLTDCLFAPSEVTVSGTGSATFGRGVSSAENVYVKNSFYTKSIGTVQGYGYSFDSAPANIGTQGAAYSVSSITPYTNGILFNEKYFVAPTPIYLASANDNTTTISDANGYVADVTLSGRSLYKDGDWNTICLPFDVVLEGSPLDGATARPLSEASITGSTLNLKFDEPVVDKLVAGTPYIIKWTKTDDYVDDDEHNIVAPVFNGVTIDKTDHSYDNKVNDNTRVRFLGTYKSMEFTEENRSILFVGADNTLYYPQPASGQNLTIGAQRAYFKIGEDGAALARQLTAFNFDLGEVETSSLPQPLQKEGSQATAGWYTLDGRKLDGKPTKKGIYIYNGKKVIM